MGNDETGLSAAEIRDLRDIAGTMIPAKRRTRHARRRRSGHPGRHREVGRPRSAHGPPGAGGDRDRTRGGPFSGLDRDRREALINDYATSGGAAAASLGRVILGAYYRDDRVLLALGLEARAPFPKGYTLEQGDWSLLDAVRHRPPLWRDDRPAPAGKR